MADGNAALQLPNKPQPNPKQSDDALVLLAEQVEALVEVLTPEESIPLKAVRVNMAVGIPGTDLMRSDFPDTMADVRLNLRLRAVLLRPKGKPKAIPRMVPLENVVCMDPVE